MQYAACRAPAAHEALETRIEIDMATTSSRLPFKVPELCYGTAPLGNAPSTYGYGVTIENAHATIRAIFDQPDSFIDTSRNYGNGLSEEFVGEVARERGGFPEHAILSTKIDRDFETGHLDADRARRSLEISLSKLGVDRVDILHLHDPEHCADLDEIVRKGGAMDELFKMKEEGLASAVGLAMGRVPLMSDLLPRWEFDALINHNRWTLLNRSADRMYEDAHARGIAILNAAPYASGVLAKGSSRTNRITYRVVSDEALNPVRSIEEICARHGVPTGAVALQFSMRDPRVASTIIGISRPERIAQTREWADFAVPDACWDEVLALPASNEDPEAGRDIRA